MTQIGGVPDMHDEDDYPYDNPVSRAQAESLREQARAGGLRFEAYLPPALADWLLEPIERGMFADPSEAVFAIVGNFRDLEPHRDLRDALLRRLLQAAVDDPRPRSGEHQSELQSLMRISYAVFCLKKKKQQKTTHNIYIMNINEIITANKTA